MGEIDINIKNFIKIDSVFSQLFSQGVFGGEIQIDPDKLQEFDTASQETVKNREGEMESLERLRDARKVAMLFDKKVAFQVIMGVEGQTGVHYYMPVRCMELDALSYMHQCKKISEKAKEGNRLEKFSDGIPRGTKIIPVVTLVFYVGSRPWDGPVSIYDMLDIPDNMKEWMKSTASDYRMNLIDARHMSDEEIDRFEGDLKVFLLMLCGRYNREKLKSVIAMHRETWYAISAIKKDRRYIEYIDSVSDEEVMGGVNMDAALDYIEAKGKAEGIDKVNQLALLLFRDGRIDDFVESAGNVEYQKQLFVEYGLEEP